MKSPKTIRLTSDYLRFCKVKCIFIKYPDPAELDTLHSTRSVHVSGLAYGVYSSQILEESCPILPLIINPIGTLKKLLKYWYTGFGDISFWFIYNWREDRTGLFQDLWWVDTKCEPRHVMGESSSTGCFMKIHLSL